MRCHVFPKSGFQGRTRPRKVEFCAWMCGRSGKAALRVAAKHDVDHRSLPHVGRPSQAVQNFCRACQGLWVAPRFSGVRVSGYQGLKFPPCHNANDSLLADSRQPIADSIGQRPTAAAARDISVAAFARTRTAPRGVFVLALRPMRESSCKSVDYVERLAATRSRAERRPTRLPSIAPFGRDLKDASTSSATNGSSAKAKGTKIASPCYSNFSNRSSSNTGKMFAASTKKLLHRASAPFTIPMHSIANFRTPRRNGRGYTFFLRVSFPSIRARVRSADTTPTRVR